MGRGDGMRPHPPGLHWFVVGMTLAFAVGVAVAAPGASVGAPDPIPFSTLPVACSAVGTEYPGLLDVSSNSTFFSSTPAPPPSTPPLPATGGTGGGGSLPHPPPNGTVPVLSNVTTGQVATWFLHVCALPAFGELLGQHGVGSFVLGGAGNVSNGSASVSFGFSWVTGCPAGTWAGAPACTEEEYWSEEWVGSPSNASLVGPLTTFGPAVTMGPGGGAPSAPGAVSLGSWSAGTWIAIGLWGGAAGLVAGLVLWEHRRRPPASLASAPV